MKRKFLHVFLLVILGLLLVPPVHGLGKELQVARVGLLSHVALLD